MFLYGCGTLSPVSIQTQSLALRALRKRKPQETQAIAFGWKPGFRYVIAVFVIAVLFVVCKDVRYISVKLGLVSTQTMSQQDKPTISMLIQSFLPTVIQHYFALRTERFVHVSLINRSFAISTSSLIR